jgi:hypothetical protein
MTERNTQPTAPGLIPEAPPAYPEITDVPGVLGVPLTQRGMPDLRSYVPSRFIPLEEAAARGWSLFYDGRACRYGHQAARGVSNVNVCTDCLRIKEGRPPIYPKSRAQEFREHVRKDSNAPIANAAPVIVAPPAPPEPSPKDQAFLAKLDELRDFDQAAEAVGTKRGLIEARASSNPVFRAALTDLCERRSIAWTRAPDPASFSWSPEIETALVTRYVDVGLLEQARQELGVSASTYQAHLRDSSAFAAMVAEAEPLARSTLRERAMAEAARGNDRLARLMEDEFEQGVFTDPMGRKVPYINPAAARQELQTILDDVEKSIRKQELLEDAAKQRNKTAGVVVEAAAVNKDLVTA